MPFTNSSRMVPRTAVRDGGRGNVERLIWERSRFWEEMFFWIYCTSVLVNERIQREAFASSSSLFQTVRPDIDFGMSSKGVKRSYSGSRCPELRLSPWPQIAGSAAVIFIYSRYQSNDRVGTSRYVYLRVGRWCLSSGCRSGLI